MNERTTEAGRLSSLISTGTASDVIRLLREINAAAYSNRIRYAEAFDLSMQCAARLKAMPTPEQYRALMARVPIHEFGLDRRTVSVLANSHRCIFYASELLDLTEQDIIDLRNAGTKTLENVKAALRAFGLTLKPGDDER